ncbi:MAG: hypothetical protein SF066_05775 [Thermoanaerobaculia bacterium]|nr:hypothetical protein [Thermoanaerobaculia bacterium]
MWSSFRRVSLWIGGAVLALGFAASAEAQTANFQGNCSWNATFTQFTCQYDALLPAGNPSACPGSFIWRVRFDYSDGTSTGLIPPTTKPSKTYASSVVNPNVTLTVICWSGAQPTLNRTINHPFGVPNGININGTWN